MYVSAQSLDFLDLAEKCLISNLETASVHLLIFGWALVGFLRQERRRLDVLIEHFRMRLERTGFMGINRDELLIIRQ